MNDVKVNSSELVSQPTTLIPSSSAGKEGASKGKAAEAIAKPAGLVEANASQSEGNTAGVQSEESVESAVTKLNDYVQTVQRNLQFSLDDDSGKTVITVTDTKTSEVVRQIPDDVALRLARDLLQDEPISLFSAKV